MRPPRAAPRPAAAFAPAGVVSLAGGDIDDRQALHHDPGQAAQIERLIIRAKQFGLAPVEAVCLANQILSSGMATSRDAREERLAVGLGGDEPETVLALLELIDQVQLVVTLDRLPVGLRRRVANRGE